MSTSFGGTERLGTAVLDLTVDSSGLDKGMAKSERETSKRMDTIQRGVDRSAKVAAVGLIALGAAAVGATNKASDLDESMNKAGATFGKAAKSVPGFGKSVAQSLGMSRAAALDNAAGLGSMLLAMGKSQKEAAGMSSRMLTLAADMGSFHNQDPTDMLDRLRAGLSGEAEPLKKFGVLLSEARVKQEAVRMGLAATGDELTEQQKVQARYSLIIRDAGAANGDFARTSGGLANQQRILKAEATDLAADIGTKLIPIGLAAVSMFRDIVTWVQQNQTAAAALAIGAAVLGSAIIALSVAMKIAAVATALLGRTISALPIFLIIVGIAALVAAFIYGWQNSETFRDIVKGAIAAVVTAVEWMADLVTKRIPGAFNAVLSWVRGNWQTIVSLISGPFLPIVALATDAFGVRSALIGAMRATRDTVGNIAGAIPGAIKDAITGGWATTWGAVGGFGGWLWDKISAGIAHVRGLVAAGADVIGQKLMEGVKAGVNAFGVAPANRVIAAMNAMIGAVDRVVPFVSIPRIPQIEAFAEGGVATGPTLALFGEAGTEVIVPVTPGKRREGRKWLSVAATMLGMKGDIPGPVGPSGFQTAMRKYGVNAFADGGVVFGPGGIPAAPGAFDQLVLAQLKGMNSAGMFEQAASFFAQRAADVIGSIPVPARTGWPLGDATAVSVREAAEGYVRDLFANRERFNLGGVVAAQTWAQSVMGRPYVWGGGHGPWNYNLPGYDCSGFASHAAKRAGSTIGSPGTTMSLAPISQRGMGPVAFGFRGMGSSNPREQHMGAKVLSTWYQFGSPGHSGGTDAQWDFTAVPPGLPSYSAGVDRIQSDGLAYLHRDEAVLAGDLAAAFRVGAGGGPLVEIKEQHVHDEMSEAAAAAKVGTAVWRELAAP